MKPHPDLSPEADPGARDKGERSLSEVSAAPAMLYGCTVLHRRLCAPRYRFRYRVFQLLLDIDRIDELAARSRWFSHNRFNLIAFHDRDHGGRDGGGLRAWVDGLLDDHGLSLQGGRVQLLCLPRVLGYGFNPISIWYCEHRDGRLRAIVCEVNNTFGEHHFYLLHDNGQPMSWPVRKHKVKRLHVSPLFDMRGEYSFRFTRPGDALAFAIQLHRDGQRTLGAAVAGRGVPADDAHLLRALARLPLMTFKVTAAIHWQALKIALRGARFHRKPAPPKEQVS